MDLASHPNTILWISTGLASCLLVTGVLLICAEFRRKQKKSVSSEPVQLVYKQSTAEYQMPNVSLRPPNGHLDVVQHGRNERNERNHSPTWRNSSLSRELPAIPNTSEGAVGDVRYESASNLYACLDDVRVTTGHQPNPQASDSSGETPFPVPLPLSRVHPYDRIGGPTASTSAGLASPQEPTASTSFNHTPHTQTHTQTHAQVLQQMDNEAAVYRGARSDTSYTSVTVRAPLSDLIARRLSEDGGYVKVPGDENHLYAQVGGEYGGSVGSEQLGGSAHIYSELYAEIDALSNGGGAAHYSALINPYATSSLQGGTAAGPSTSALTDEERDKLYAKVTKPTRGRQKNSFADSHLNQASTSVAGGGRGRGEGGRRGTAPVASAEVVDVYGVGDESPPSASSVSSLRASLDAAITNMDTSVSAFVSGGGVGGRRRQTSGDGGVVVSGPRGYTRREHVYELVPDC